MNEIKETEVYNRLKQYEQDFLYSMSGFYHAVKRLNKQQKALLKKHKNLNISRIVISFITISGAAMIFGEFYPKIAIFGIFILALISMIISVYLLQQKNNLNIYMYEKRAERYNDLYKKVKNVLAKADDNIIDLEGLSKKLDEISSQEEKLRSIALNLEEEDYKKGKLDIKKGNYRYE